MSATATEVVEAEKDRDFQPQLSLHRLSSSTVGKLGSEEVGTYKGRQGFERQGPLRRLSSGGSFTGEVGKEKGFDRQVWLQRLSSGSSYAGSLFSGTTLDGSLSSCICKDSTTAVKEEEEESGESLAQRLRKSYYMQLTLAKRLSQETTLDSEPTLLQQYGGARADAEIVSYRLWISDGFFNILGMNPYLWVLCNELEEGRRLPPLMELKSVEPSDTSMEVVLVDRDGDSRLRELEDIAQELYFAAENTLVLVEKLGKLVAIFMGGSFPLEQGDLHVCWRLVSKKLRELRKCIVVPMGSLSMGLCRHCTILFKKLADSIGLPCRIARGCKYCVADHHSSCLVKIDDDKNFPREFVVDLVGEPGNVHGPDSSINGGVVSSVTSPFQISHLKEFQQPCMDDGSFCQILKSKNACAPAGNLLCPGSKQERHPVEDGSLHEVRKESIFSHINQESGVLQSLETIDDDDGAGSILIDQYSRPDGNKGVVGQAYSNEVILSERLLSDKNLK